MGGDALGVVYVLTNPAWPGLTKIGSAACAMRRLHSFQTGDPHRAYRMHAAVETPDWRRVERKTHSFLASCRVDKTEWFRIHPDDAVLAIEHALKEIEDERRDVGRRMGRSPSRAVWYRAPNRAAGARRR